MNNREIEMENILKYLEKIRVSYRQDITKDTVYNYLTKGLINDEDKGIIKDLFPNFISYFQNRENICVFNSPNWRYFCQFCNFKKSKKTYLFNAIKMYLSVSKTNIKQVGFILFDFLEKNNIYHESKIGSEVRTDDIVIRVYSKEDEEKIRNFINSQSFIKKSLMKTIPFCFRKNNIGYAVDGSLSYNGTLSKYLKNYINKSYKNKEEVSLEGFIRFVTNIYNNVFENKRGVTQYIEDYIDDNEIHDFSREEMLNNYAEVTRLLIVSMKTNDFSYFQKMVDVFNNNKEVVNNIKRFKNTEDEDIDMKIVYLNKAILETYKKYGMKQVISALQSLYIKGDYQLFTRENDARKKLKENVSIDNFRYIVNIYANGDVIHYIEKYIQFIEENDDIKKF